MRTNCLTNASIGRPVSGNRENCQCGIEGWPLTIDQTDPLHTVINYLSDLNLYKGLLERWAVADCKVVFGQSLEQRNSSVDLDLCKVPDRDITIQEPEAVAVQKAPQQQKKMERTAAWVMWSRSSFAINVSQSSNTREMNIPTAILSPSTPGCDKDVSWTHVCIAVSQWECKFEGSTPKQGHLVFTIATLR